MVHRRAARVLLLDGRGRLLLFHGRDPLYADRGHWWFTPGGGLDPHETPAQAAVRELREETGLVVTVADLEAPVHHRTTTFPWGDEVYEQEEDYFLLRVDAHEVDTSGFDEVETSSVVGHRWWVPAELGTSGERYYPSTLLDLLP